MLKNTFFTKFENVPLKWGLMLKNITSVSENEKFNNLNKMGIH